MRPHRRFTLGVASCNTVNMSIHTWWIGARPRTLPAAVVPVAVGVAAGSATGEISWWRAVVALVVSLALQVGVNFANDYSDGIKGTDDDRTGPLRLVASGTARPGQVRAAAGIAFGCAALAGVIAAASTSWWLLAIGAASIAAGVFYTGGPRPYGYLGLGEVFVFTFFGVVATCGSAFVATGAINARAALASIPVGLLAVALLMANNLRDIPSDARAGKRTLAVRIGDRRMRAVFVATFVVTAGTVALVATIAPWAMLALAGVAMAIRPVSAVVRGAHGSDLIAVLEGTAMVQVFTGALLVVGLLI